MVSAVFHSPLETPVAPTAPTADETTQNTVTPTAVKKADPVAKAAKPAYDWAGLWLPMQLRLQRLGAHRQQHGHTHRAHAQHAGVLHPHLAPAKHARCRAQHRVVGQQPQQGETEKQGEKIFLDGFHDKDVNGMTP